MDPYTYSNEFIGLLFENNEKLSILTSHLIIGYEPLNLISNYLSKGKYNIKTNLKFLENNQNESNKK
ncbi:unnamed protein product, partial [Rotaria sp. Silwood2]